MRKIQRWLTVLLVIFVTVASGFTADHDVSIQKLASLNKIGSHFSFIVIGDNKLGGDTYFTLIEQAMKNKPAFIVNTGDQVRHPDDLKEWESFWKLSRHANVPYFLTAGNHDVHDKAGEQMFREQAGLQTDKPYYSFTVGNSIFIVLDSNIDRQKERIKGRQYHWLKDVLANTRQKHKFIFIHHPLFPDKDRGHHFGSCLDKYPGERDRLQALFVRNKVTAVFSGHEHLYLRKNINGIMHIITGGGGAPLYAGNKDGGFYHFIHITVDGDKVAGESVDIEGKVRDRISFDDL